MCKYDYACVYLCALRMRRTGIGNMSTMSPRDWEGKVDRVWLSVQIRERKKMSRAIHIWPISRERREMLGFFLSLSETIILNV